MSQEAIAIQGARRRGDERGTLVCLEAGVHVPFDVRSVVYIHSVPMDVRRGGHAHYTLHQFIKCVAGAVTVSLTDLDGQTVLVTTTDHQLPMRRSLRHLVHSVLPRLISKRQSSAPRLPVR